MKYVHRVCVLNIKIKYEACEVRKIREFTLVNDRFPDNRNEVFDFIFMLFVILSLESDSFIDCIIKVLG